jgi:hypothetical protein
MHPWLARCEQLFCRVVMVDAVVFICIVANEQATVDKLAASLLGVIGDIQGGAVCRNTASFFGSRGDYALDTKYHVRLYIGPS